MKKKIKRYFLMDNRANFDMERATIFEVCSTRKEAEENKSNYGDDTVIVEQETT